MGGKGIIQPGGIHRLSGTKTLALLLALCCLSAVTYGTTYYNVSGSTTLQLTSQWGVNTDGSGAHPANFTTSGDVFDMYNGSTTAISGNWTVGSGVTINIGSGSGTISFTQPNYTITATCTANVRAGATFTIQNATTPILGTIAANSTVIYGGGANYTIPNYTFGNLTISTSGSASFATGTTTVVADFNQTSGALTACTTSANSNLTIQGNCYLSGGSLDFCNAGGGGFNVNINLAQNLSITGSYSVTTTGTCNNGAFIFNGSGTATSPQLCTMSNGGTLVWTNITVNAGTYVQMAGTSTTITMTGSTTTSPADYRGTVTVNGTLDMKNYIFAASGANSVFIVNSTGVVITAHANGMGGASAGVIGSSNWTKTINAAADFIFNGTSAQITGTNMPASMTSGGLVTINNSAGVTLSQTTTFASGSTLNLQNGSLTNTSANLVMNSGANLQRDNGTLAATPTTYSGVNLSYVNLGNNAAVVTAGNEWPASFTGNITVNKPGATITLNNAKTVTGTITLTAGTLDVSSVNYGLSLTGNWTNNGSTASFIPESGTVTFNGTAAQTIGGTANTTFNSLTVNNSAGVTLSSTVTLNAGDSLNLENGTLTNGANLIMNSGANLVRDNGGLSATPSTYSGITLTYGNLGNNAAAVTTGNEFPATFTGNVIVNKTGATITLNNSKTLTGNITLTAGTLDASTSNYNILITGNWTNNASATAFTARSGTVNFNGTAAQAVAGTYATSFYNLTASNTNAALSLNTNTNVSGTLNMNGSGTLLTPAAAVVINNAAAAGTINGNGTIQVTRIASTADYLHQYKFSTNTLTGLTVDYTGAGAQTINSTVGNYGTLKTSTSGTKTLAGAVVTNNDLNIGSGTTLDVTTGNYNLTIGGNWTNNGIFTAQNGTVYMSGTATGLTLSGAMTGSSEFYNLVFLGGAGAAWSFSALNAEVGNTFNISSGTVTAPADTLTVHGNWFNGATFSNNGGSVVFNQTFSGIVINGTTGGLTGGNKFNHIAFTGSGGAWSFSLPADVGGNMTIGTGATATAPSGILQLAGNWTNNGTFTNNSGTVTLYGSSAQNIAGSSATVFNNLILNNSAGATLGVSETVNGTLTLSTGLLNIGAYNLILGPSAPAVSGTFSSTAMIVASSSGQVRKLLTANSSYLFPIGDNSPAYAPITLSVTGSAYSGGYIGVNVYNTKDPHNANLSNYLNRYWAVGTSGITSPSYSVTGAYYAAGDVVGTESAISGGAYTGSLPWIKFGGVNTSAHSFSTTAVTATSCDFTGITAAPPVVTASASSAICSGGAASLSVSAFTADPAVSYTWAPSATLSASTGSAVSATPSVTTVYTVTIKDGNGFTNTANTTVSVNPAPSLSGVTNNGPICAGGTLTLTASGATNVTGYAWSGPAAITSSGTASASVPSATTGASGTYTITVSNGSGPGCAVSYTTAATVNATPSASPTNNGPVCAGGTVTLAANPAGGATVYAWAGPGLSSTTAANPTSIPTATVTYSLTVSDGSGHPGCAPATVYTTTVTYNTAPTASPTNNGPVCSASSVTLSANPGGSANAYAWSGPGLATTTAQNPTASPTVTSTYSLTVSYGSGLPGCSPTTVYTTTVTVRPNGYWLGNTSTSWTTNANWCGNVPLTTTSVVIPSGASFYPSVTSGVSPSGSLTIQSGASLTVSGGTLQISGAIANSGTFTASGGSIELNGSTAQTIPANTFASNTIGNLTISNTAGATLAGTLKISGILKANTGSLTTGGFLTLLSTATQTALIDGSGAGEVYGSVTMQRYLDTSYGYRYISSPFTAATVGGLSGSVNLSAGFPAFYSYTENVAYTGWTTDTTAASALSPLVGYAANFGTSFSSETISLSGTVSNHSISATLYNHNQPYTLGYNLVGNPYPSPVDWTAATGWTKTNIDNAIYYFNAGDTNQYYGTYSSYISGVSSDGVASNIIPAMQGFFVHVSSGTYPVTGTLAVNNPARVNNLSPFYHRPTAGATRPLVRLSAGFSGVSRSDPTVVYGDEQAADSFDNNLDALKMLNTDAAVPSLYSLLPGSQSLSIRAVNFGGDSTYLIPLGLQTARGGTVIFNARDLENLPQGTHVYFYDTQTGTSNDVEQQPTYTTSLGAGKYENRFFLLFTTKDKVLIPGFNGELNAYASGEIIYVYLPAATGHLMVTDLAGQVVKTAELSGVGFHAVPVQVSSSIYIATLYSEMGKQSKKLFIGNK